jgi:endoglucanase
MALALAAGAAYFGSPAVKAAESGTSGNPLPYRELSADEIIGEMGAGWNLGNTMDGHTGFTPSEILWQNVVTTKALMKAVHDLGFNTVRIPVTWGTMIDDANGYAIDDKWISRVQDIVDYCIAQDMYVIINLHHDGAEQSGWLRVAAEDIDPVYEKFEGVWRNIAQRFKDYDEHLIFESMNEVVGDDNSDAGCIRDTQVIMNLNQIFVDTVRSTGSNNALRWLSVPGRYTNIDKMTDPKIGFDLPKDSVENRLFVSVHYYDFNFGMNENGSFDTFTYDQVLSLASHFQKLEERFTSRGIPVILGEYGAINKNNPAERAYHIEALTRICQAEKIVACYWDQGWYDRTLDPDYSYALVDRSTGKSIDPAVTDALMRGTYLPAASEDYSDIIKDTKVINITELKVSEEKVTLTLGDNKKLTAEYAPADSNDIVLWKTGDETVVTVFNGNLRARGIGTATVTAFSQSGSVEKTVQVTVNAKAGSAPCTAINLDSSEYETEIEGCLNLEPGLEPAGTDAYVTYRSSKEEVACVSPLGKVVGKAAGTAYITAAASSGVTKTVKVTVKEADSSKELPIAINVYYNDGDTSYYSNEVGESVTVSGDGQYTLTFDCTKHLSDAAKAAGVTGLNNLTAVYIKDYNVTRGLEQKSPLVSCNIMYNKVVVDGVGLTVNQTEPKSAIKASGILDTNDPLNSWDGSFVNEVTVDNHVLNISTITNPQVITVTFTLSDMVFEGSGSDSGSEPAGQTTKAGSLIPGTTELIVFGKEGETVDISALVAPADAAAYISFVSSDESVVYVNPTAVTVDSSTGNAVITLTAMGNGTAAVTAMTENGLSAAFRVQVGAPQEEAAETTQAPAVEAAADAPDTSGDTSDSSSFPAVPIVIAVLAVAAAGVAISAAVRNKRSGK